MTVDKTTICNMAIGMVGASKIADINTTRSPSAEACNDYYDTALDAALQSMDWNFARARATLSLLTEDAPEEWTYAYTYPAECVRAIKLSVADRRTNTRYPFEVGLSEDYSKKALFCDVQNASLVYTRRVTDPSFFPASFVEAFATKLASLIAVPLTRKTSFSQGLEKRFYLVLSKAQAVDANEMGQDEPPESTFVEARN